MTEPRAPIQERFADYCDSCCITRILTLRDDGTYDLRLSLRCGDADACEHELCKLAGIVPAGEGYCELSQETKP